MLTNPSAIDEALDMLRSEIGVFAPQEHDPVEAARAELAALRAENEALKERDAVLEEVNDNLREALGIIGIAVATGDVQAEARSLDAKIEKLRSENEALRANGTVLGRSLDEWRRLEQELALRDINSTSTVDGIVAETRKALGAENAALRVRVKELEIITALDKCP